MWHFIYSNHDWNGSCLLFISHPFAWNQFHAGSEIQANAAWIHFDSWKNNLRFSFIGVQTNAACENLHEFSKCNSGDFAWMDSGNVWVGIQDGWLMDLTTALRSYDAYKPLATDSVLYLCSQIPNWKFTYVTHFVKMRLLVNIEFLVHYWSMHSPIYSDGSNVEIGQS